MTVKELIKELQKYDENMEVVIYDREDRTHDTVFEFSKEIESYMIWKNWKPLWSRIDKTKELAEINTSKWERKTQKDILVIYADY